jgi:hypothetical protein
MKILLSILTLFLLVTGAWAQSPQYVPYQAVARNSAGNLLVNQAVGLRFTVHQSTSGGTTQYQETQTATTNKLGLFSVNVGSGTVVSGSFSGITWSDGQPKYMQVEIDPTGGTSYTNMGATQMMSVPYALFAGSAASVPSLTGGNGITISGNTISDNLWTLNGANIGNANSGNVGIGTTSPSAQLHTTGTVMFADYPNGMLGTSAAGLLHALTLTGTANQIDIINGNGVSGNPTFAIDPSYTAQLKAQAIMTGGGTVTYSGGYLAWNNRFIVINNGNGPQFSTNGYFDINQPPSGTVITGYGSTGNVTATASGIPLGCWDALYYILPVGSSNVSQNGNFVIAQYNAAFTVPSNWILIANQNCDDGSVRLGNGTTLIPGQSSNAGSGTFIDNSTASQTGNFNITGNGSVGGNLSAGGTVTAGASAIMGTNVLAGYYQDVTNGAYRAIVGSGTTTGYYFQSNAGASTTMYVGLGGAYNGRVGVGNNAPNGQFDIYNTGSNGDGAVFAPDIDLDNNFTIQTYIDANIGGGGWAGRTTYAGTCCNNLALQPDVGTVSIGGTSGNYGANKLNVIGQSYFSSTVNIGSGAALQTYGNIALNSGAGGWNGMLYGPSTAWPCEMWNSAGGGIYFQNSGLWAQYFLESTGHLNIMTSADLGATLGINGNETISYSSSSTTGSPALTISNPSSQSELLFSTGGASESIRCDNGGNMVLNAGSGAIYLNNDFGGSPTLVAVGGGNPLTISASQIFDNSSARGTYTWGSQNIYVNEPSSSAYYSGIGFGYGGTGEIQLFGSSGYLLVQNGPGNAWEEVEASGFYSTSDINVKKDVQYLQANDFSDCLEQIRNIQSIRFRYKYESEDHEPEKNYRPHLHLGMVAQSLPVEVVDSIPADGKVNGDRVLGVSLGDMEGLLTAGVKAVDDKTQILDKQAADQAQLIQQLQQTVEDLKNRLSLLEKK